MLKHHASGRPLRGFTIIEMAVTLVVFGIMLAAAMPSIGTWMDNTRIRNVTDSIQNGLQTARAEAVRRNQSVSFWLVDSPDPNVLSNSCDLSNTSGSWVVSVNAPNGHCADSPSTTTSPMIVTGRPAGESGANVAVSALQSDVTTAGTTVTFNGFGRVTNTDAVAQIDITGTDSETDYRYLRLEISGSGMVRSCDPRVTSSTDPRKCLCDVRVTPC